MGLNQSAQLQVLQHQVASAARAGANFEEIERGVIEPSSCSQEAKRALQLYAFSFVPRFDQRRIAFDRMRAVAQGETDLDPFHLAAQRPEGLGKRLCVPSEQHGALDKRGDPK